MGASQAVGSTCRLGTSWVHVSRMSGTALGTRFPLPQQKRHEPSWHTTGGRDPRVFHPCNGLTAGCRRILLQPLKPTWLLPAIFENQKTPLALLANKPAQIPTISMLLSYSQAPEELQGARINDKIEEKIVTDSEIQGEKGSNGKDRMLWRAGCHWQRYIYWQATLNCRRKCDCCSLGTN